MVLTFVRAGVRCAILAANVRGIAPTGQATRVPGAPRPLRGVIAWRGAVVPIVEPTEHVAESWKAAVIVSGEAGDMALAADTVEGWIERASASLVLDIDGIQQRLRERIRRGSEKVRPPTDTEYTR